MGLLRRLMTHRRVPLWAFHLPTVLAIAWHAVRLRSLLFFTAANPMMARYGFSGLAKDEIMEGIDARFLPATEVVSKRNRERAVRRVEKNLPGPPWVVKPRRGMRGRGITLVHSLEELEERLSSTTHELLVQEWIGLPQEYGVLYRRLPGEAEGRIVSLAEKKLPVVVGDGERSLAELIEALSARERGRAAKFLAERLEDVPAAGQEVAIEFIAQPFLGTSVLSRQDDITQAMERCFDMVCDPLDGFHYGRFDAKASSLEALEQDGLESGERLVLLELNLTGSMPLHMWDPENSLLDIYRCLWKHWRDIAEVSKRTIARGEATMKIRQVASVLKKLRRESHEQSS